MSITVNGEDAEPGCFIAGHHGQYGMDQLGDIAEGFGLAFEGREDPRQWRKEYDEAQTQEQSERAFEMLVEAADFLEQLLNERTTGGYWSWEDGEFFLTQTQVEGLVYLPVDEGDDYDDAWRWLCENGPVGLVGDYNDLDNGQRAFTFKITINYEPEE